MKFDVARQPLLSAVAVLLLVAVAGVVRYALNPLPAETVEGFRALTFEWLGVVEQRWPSISLAAAITLLLLTGLTLGRIGVRYNLYAVGTCLGVSLYGILSCGIFVGKDFLTGFLAAFLLSRVLSNYCASLRNGYAFDALFRGSFYLGLMLLVYPTAFPFVLLLPWTLLTFKRTLREAVVALSGLLLPPATVCYLWWGAGNEFLAPLAQLWQAFIAPSGFRLLETLSPVVLLFLGFSLFLLLCAVLFFMGDRYASGSKARTILTYDLGVLLLASALFPTPSSTATLFAVAAVPASLVLPFLFVRIRPEFALLAYSSMLILCVLRFWW